MSDREKKRLATRAKSDKQKKKLARAIIQDYGTTRKPWVELCKQHGISISTLWAWVEKYELEREKQGAMLLAKTAIVKYNSEEKIPVKETQDGGLIPTEETDEYRTRAFAINRICLRYGMGEGKDLDSLIKDEMISKNIFYRYVQNFDRLGRAYKEAKLAREKLLQFSLQEAKISIAEGLVRSLVQQVNPVTAKVKTTTTKETPIGTDPKTGRTIFADEIITKVQKKTQLPSAQILMLAAKALGWLGPEDAIVDGSDMIGEFDADTLLNHRADDLDKLEQLRKQRGSRRALRSTTAPTQPTIQEAEVIEEKEDQND